MMTATTTPSPADRLSIPLDGMRKALAVEATRKGPAGALAVAILSLLDAILALLMEFKAGTLAAANLRLARADQAADHEPSPSPSPAKRGRVGVGVAPAPSASAAASTGCGGASGPPPPADLALKGVSPPFRVAAAEAPASSLPPLRSSTPHPVPDIGRERLVFKNGVLARGGYCDHSVTITKLYGLRAASRPIPPAAMPCRRPAASVHAAFRRKLLRQRRKSPYCAGSAQVTLHLVEIPLTPARHWAG
jgi:hypothetical protein